MKLSRFNVWVKDHPAEGDYILFNTRTQALIKVTRQFKEALEEYIGLYPLPKEIEESLAVLNQNGIIVEDEEEEGEKLRDFFRQLKYECSKLAFEATILTTYSCNFRCEYCFEEGVKDDVFLDKETSIAIVNWLIRRAEKRSLKRIFLVYYGGEPLLNLQPMYDISWLMQEWSKKKNIEFGFAIITNGSLINPGLVDKLLPLGLRLIRVTIDGDRDTHNRKRPFLDGTDTFDLIIHNIKSIIDKVDVGVVGNFDRQSIPGLYRLLDYLEEERLLRRLSGIGFAPIVPRLGPRSNPRAVELFECLSFIGKDGLFEETVGLKKELMLRGVKVSTGLAVNACPLFMEDAGVTIDPRGVIYKCNSLLGYPEFSVGNVREEDFNDTFRTFFDLQAWEKCPSDCPYVPMCQGGCRFFSYIENGNFSDLACKREYLDRIVPELIKLEYEKVHASPAVKV